MDAKRTSDRAPASEQVTSRAPVPPALLEKLKLLPLRERELSTLRQVHQHHLRWIQAAQELMVRLSNSPDIPEALDALLKSLVEEFGFDISAASTEGSLAVGDPVRDLTSADHAFLQRVLGDAGSSKALVISSGEDIVGERTLAWLMADGVGSIDIGEEPVVVVGRTVRTAPYYPSPNAQEAGLYRHLLSTVAQVFRSISLQARNNSELERKVFERTEELKIAQLRVVQLEREKIAEQMAGGFAHEMRNALSGAKHLIEKGMGAGDEHERSLVDDTAAQLKQLFLRARETLSPEALDELRRSIQSITKNERMLDEILRHANCSLERALSITTLIMDYSRIGYSRRGSDPVDLTQLARSVLAESSDALSAQQIVATVEAADPCWLCGLEVHLYSILKNLVVNAFDALCEAGVNRPRLLRVELERRGPRNVLRVSDNALGIPEAIRDRIFEPFFSTKPQTGTGLGLGMVQKLVALHEGTLELDSVIGQGTTFTLSFPCQEEKAPPSERINEKREVETTNVTG